MSTNTDLDPVEIITFYVRRWQIEVTFAETRAHLGVETQRQWNDKAILRTTPSLMALYSRHRYLNVSANVTHSLTQFLCRFQASDFPPHVGGGLS